MNRNYIHDIKPTSRTQKQREAFHREHELRMKKMGLDKSEDIEEYEAPRARRPRGGDSGRGVWYVAGLAIIILVFALTFVFAGATVYVTPREGTVELSGPILAEKEPRSGLAFEMLSTEDSRATNVAAGEKTMVEKKATGTVRLFNNNGSVEQKLLIDTRLEAPNGYIYKTKKPVVIPGQKLVNGKTTPGSVDVEVYADEAGDVYNTDKTTFKVVGFRGSPKYNNFYGETVTAISGGFKGESFDISDEDLKRETDILKGELSTSLLEKARAEVPSEFILYDKAVTISYDEPTISAADESGKVEIKQTGILNAVIFKEVDLTKSLVGKVIADTTEHSVTIPNIRELNIELDKASVITNPENMESVKIIIDDKIRVVWDINEAEIKDVLAGIKKRDFEPQMLTFKNIESAELSLKPFWKNTLPSKPSAIKIINNFSTDAI